MFSRIADTIGNLPTQAQWELDTFHEFARQVDEGWQFSLEQGVSIEEILNGIT
jgi:hypothetical protein